MGSKRNRILTRQPRVKRDSDSITTKQPSPDPTTASAIEFDPFAAAASQHSAAYHHHLHHHHLLAVPPRIERHASEPAPSITPSSPHLLSVPSSTPYLIKQHSDPLLPSQHLAAAIGSNLSGGSSTSPFAASLHRQYSHPLLSSHGPSSTAIIGSDSTSHPHHLSMSEHMYGMTSPTSPPPTGGNATQYVIPTTITSGSTPSNDGVPGSGPSECSSPNIGGIPTTLHHHIQLRSVLSPTSKALNLPHFTTTHVGVADMTSSKTSPNSGGYITLRSSTEPDNLTTSNTKFKQSKSTSSVVLLTDASGSIPSTSTATVTSSSFEHLPSLRVKNEELQRSVSSPQTTREIITLENPRSSHCPVIRPGPALGCNFCWNTIDGHGRILRRKTKYHCPECQTNLCIVPCFQEYHERLNNETSTAGTSNAPPSHSSGESGAGGIGGSNRNFSSTSGGSGSGSSAANVSGSLSARHYHKTESI